MSQSKICQRIWGTNIFMIKKESSTETHKSAFCSMNLRQIWVFPMPPIPYKRKKTLFPSDCVLKWLFNLLRYVSRPVKSLLACLRGRAILLPVEGCWIYDSTRVSKLLIINHYIHNSHEPQWSCNLLSQSPELCEKIQRICFPSRVTLDEKRASEVKKQDVVSLFVTRRRFNFFSTLTACPKAIFTPSYSCGKQHI